MCLKIRDGMHKMVLRDGHELDLGANSMADSDRFSHRHPTASTYTGGYRSVKSERRGRSAKHCRAGDDGAESSPDLSPKLSKFGCGVM